MYRSIWAWALLASLAFAAPAWAQNRDENWKRCIADDPDLSIGG